MTLLFWVLCGWGFCGGAVGAGRGWFECLAAQSWRHRVGSSPTDDASFFLHLLLLPFPFLLLLLLLCS
jgi:hypothetical protein